MPSSSPFNPKPYTDKEMEKMREDGIKILRHFKIEADGFTCDECPSRFYCRFVFCMYNLDGECIVK